MNNLIQTVKTTKTTVTVFVLLFSLAFRFSASAQTDSVANTHSPKKALILSAILPGTGQVYNRQAWKVPIVYAAIGGIGYYTYNNYTQMKYYKDEYLYRVNHNDNPLDEELSNTPTSNVYNLYEAYNKTFQLSVIVTVAVYGLNLLDAYVFGHLFDFQITDDLTLNIAPSFTPILNNSHIAFAPAASLTFRF